MTTTRYTFEVSDSLVSATRRGLALVVGWLVLATAGWGLRDLTQSAAFGAIAWDVQGGLCASWMIWLFPGFLGLRSA